MAAKLSIALVVLATVYSYGEALDCYDCYRFEYDTNNFILGGILDTTNALSDKNCMKEGDNFLDNASKTKTCASDSYCYKTFVNYNQDIFGSNVKVKVFARGCEMKSNQPNYKGPGCATGSEVNDYWPADPSQTNRGGKACGCETDLCNGSSHVILGSLVFICSIIFSIFM